MGIVREVRTIKKSVAGSPQQELPAMPPTPAPVTDPIREKYEQQKKHDAYIERLLAKKEKDEELVLNLKMFR